MIVTSVILRFKLNLKTQPQEMKPTSTLRIAIAIFFSIAFSNSFAQTATPVATVFTNLKASVENNNLVINWNLPENVVSDYCLVQVSFDGKTFSTLGMVMGADPKQANNSFIFKQNMKKMKSGHVYYRVYAVDNAGGHTSNIIKSV